MATEDAAATGAVVAQDAAEKAGMPQLDFSTFPNQIFWLLVALGAIYLIVTRIAVPRIGAVLAERRGTIANDLAAADDLKQKALAAEKDYNKALAEARTEAARIMAAAKAEIQGDFDAASKVAEVELAVKTEQSKARIAEIESSMLASVTEVANDTAEAIVAAFGGMADAAAVSDAVSRNMKGPAR